MNSLTSTHSIPATSYANPSSSDRSESRVSSDVETKHFSDKIICPHDEHLVEQLIVSFTPRRKDFYRRGTSQKLYNYIYDMEWCKDCKLKFQNKTDLCLNSNDPWYRFEDYFQFQKNKDGLYECIRWPEGSKQPNFMPSHNCIYDLNDEYFYNALEDVELGFVTKKY